MLFSKLSKILAAILGLLGILFLVLIIVKGDDAIKAAQLEGDTAAIDPIATIAYIVLGITLAFVLFFVLKSTITNPKGLKNTLIGVGLFALIMVLAYVFTGGDTTEYLYNGAPATENESHIAGTGLLAFYILLAGALVAMLFSGIKKIMN